MPSSTASASPSTASWRAGFAAGETLQRVRPRESFDYLPNPHRGTTTFQRFNGDELYPGLSWDDSVGPLEFKPFDGRLENPRYPNTTLSYCRWLWSVIEPQKGKIRWDVIDGALEAARVRGQTLQLRIQPYIGNDTPEWYWAAGGKVDAKQPGETKHIDHNHPLYLKHWGDLIRAFGKRYDGHPALESFDIAYGGPCGEVGGNSTPATSRKLVDIYLKSFKKSTLVSMLGTFGCKYASKFERVGWRADCYGDMRAEGKGHVPDGLCWNHMYDAYPKEIIQDGVQDRWKTAPVTFETCWTVGYWANQGWDVDWILEQGLKNHVSIFMPKSSFIPDEWREKIDAWDRRLGYRFVLRQMNLPLEVKPKQRCKVFAWIENVGVAPIYRDYQFALRFKQGDKAEIVPIKSDIRQWMPGDTIIDDSFTVPATLKHGEAAVEIGIIERKSKLPRVLFANTGRQGDGWLALTRMDIL
jgi:hypothetical protein